jgi:hypothetical protein
VSGAGRIYLVGHAAGWRIRRPGARYAVTRVDDIYSGKWIPDDEPLCLSYLDLFTENEARMMLPFLRSLDHGNKKRPSTNEDGQVVDQACTATGMSVRELSVRLGIHESTLSRVRSGNRALTKAQRAALAQIAVVPS